METMLTIPAEVATRVLNEPRLFSSAVNELAGIDASKEARTSDELARMRLCRDALCQVLATRHKHLEDMLHNSTANVHGEKSPYFGG